MLNSTLPGLSRLTEFLETTTFGDIRNAIPVSDNVLCIAPICVGICLGSVSYAYDIASLHYANRNNIHFLARKGYLSRVQSLVRDGINLEARVMGNTPLLCAIISGQGDIVKYLIEQGRADVQARDSLGQNALMLAAGFGHFEIVKYLTENFNFDLNELDPRGDSALYLAAKKADKSRNEIHFNLVRYLIDKGAQYHSILMRDDVDLKSNVLLGAKRIILEALDEKEELALQNGRQAAVIENALTDPAPDIQVLPIELSEMIVQYAENESSYDTSCLSRIKAKLRF